MPRNALVVDDSLSMRQLVCHVMQGMGYTTHEAGNGLEALVSIKQIKTLDLVIADLNMPIMDGIKLLAQLRRTPGVSVVPFLLLTTESSAQLKEKAKNAGATGWLVKPFEPAQLISVVQKIVR